MARLPAVFRFSSYLALSLATVCLGLTERGQIDGAMAFYSCICLAMLLAYLLEGRWVMPRLAANLLAVFILLGWIAWSKFSLSGVAFDAGEAGVDVLRIMLPRVGPLLAALLLAKLFRPKGVSDWWLLHTLGLIQVVLGCVLALASRLDRENFLFPITLVLYLLSGAWAMLVFYLYRESLSLTTARGAGAAARRVPDPHVRLPGRSAGARQGLGWFIASLALALALFFLMPRLGHDAAASLVIPGSTAASTGFSPTVDLNNTGPIEVNDELVMRVEGRDDRGRAVNLGADVRFRGVTCSLYENGRWRPIPFSGMVDFRPTTYYPLTHLDGPALDLTFNIDMAKIRTGRSTADGSQNQAVFLAEPIYMIPERTWPSVLESARARELSYRQAEPGLLVSTLRRSRNLQYSQAYIPDTQGKGTWLQRLPQGVTTNAYRENLETLPEHLKSSRKLKAEADRILTAANVPANASHERKARALEAYLAGSNQFSYSLEWQRQDMQLDPTEDFLLNVKQGHCELYASALALMLRSQGIPARVVIGFRGAEWNEYLELLEVRQYHAHAWVEARLAEGQRSFRNSRGTITNLEWTWLTLDPTPAGGTAGALGADRRGTWDDELQLMQYLWESLILDYSGDSEREQLMSKFAKFKWLKDSFDFWSDLANLNRTLAFLVIMAVMLFVVGLLLRHWRRRRAEARGPGTRIAFYARLLQVLERAAMRPALEQTPAEFGLAAAGTLALRLPTSDLPTVPPRIIELFYAVRFGGRQLQPQETAAINQDLERLEKALRS